MYPLATRAMEMGWGVGAQEFQTAIANGMCEPLWPRRLLHIPSMTSFERQGSNCYGQSQEPAYTVLSYTWGRFQVPEGPRIKIHGITWSIPAIDPKHFTVEALVKVLSRILSDGLEHVWIDIACIDQETPDVKAEEIGRQAGIFQRASASYVWLNCNDPRSNQEYMHSLLRLNHTIQSEQTRLEEVADDLMSSVAGILKEPWYTSLWTLQESFLAPDAHFLDKDGDFITIDPALSLSSIYADSPAAVRLNDITEAARSVNSLSQTSLEGLPSIHVEKLRQLIDESGIDSCGEYGKTKNPNILYSAARIRQTKHPEDRIYGIMQAYGFVLGKSREPSQDFTLEELEVEFLQQLAESSSVLSQSFLHASVPEEGCEWSIINHVRIPMVLRESMLNPARCPSACTITIHDKRNASFTGVGWKTSALLEFWQRQNARTIEDLQYYQGDVERFLDESRQGILLDANFNGLDTSSVWPSKAYRRHIVRCKESTESWQFNDELQKVSDDYQLKDHCMSIMEKYNEADVFVLYLGRSEREDVSDRYQTFRVVMQMGLMIGKTASTWRRIGLCYWYGRQLPDGSKPLDYIAGDHSTMTWANEHY